MQRFESSILGSAFLCNATEKKQDASVLEQCESLVADADDLLLGEKNWDQFGAIRDLLSTVRSWKVDSNFDGFSSIEIWLRYQLVSIFRKILASETLSTITDKGTSIHLGNFKEEFKKLDNDPDGVRKDICDDFIYRCALPTLQAEAKRVGKEISIEYLLNPEFPVGTLKINVTIPLMSPANEGMPYFSTRTRVDLMIDPLERPLGQTAEDYTDEVNRARDIANGYVKDSLMDRMTQFGMSDPLPTISFAAFCASRSKRAAAPVALVVDPEPSQPPSSPGKKSFSEDQSQPTSVVSEEDLSKAPSETKTVSAATAKENHEVVKTEVADAVPSTNKNRSSSLVKTFIVIAAAVLGAGVGAFIGAYLVTGLVALGVGTAIGFGVGALLGWAVPKLISCCGGRAKQSVPMAVDEQPPEEQLSAGKSPRSSHNLELDEFYRRGKEAAMSKVAGSSAATVSPRVVNAPYMHEQHVPLLEPRSPRRC